LAAGGQGEKYAKLGSAQHTMKNNPPDSVQTYESLEDESRSIPGSEATPRQQHSSVLSSLPPDYEPGNKALERCFNVLVEYYRHSSVGRRCLGVVHQVNTPLQILSFHLDLLEQKSREEQELLNGSHGADLEKLATLSLYRSEKFHQLRHELAKLQDLSRSLALQGMHEDAEERTNLDLNRLCREELELYLTDPIFKHQVSKEFHLGDGQPLIHGHYIDFSQSFRNLIDNALEAMEGMEPRHLTVVTTCQDKRFTLRIGDTGVGIPPGNLPWIFEPFFTTKQTSKGFRAGLGLFMVRRLLAPYKVEIRVDSVPGKTWVSVSIPLP
jgi:signal transduction histidine kinase